tara:strand:- start:574 stop:1269 length:696 start_codon:yes stop_codon:yes gene_type:complete
MSRKPTVFRVAENFTIRKISPKDIAARFFKGEYVNRTLPQKKIKNIAPLMKIGKNVGDNVSSEIYRFKDKGNNNQTIYTTNHSLYNYSISENTELPIIKCKYCKRNIMKNPVGLPISMEFSGGDVSFTVIDSFCDFGCTFSYLKRKNGENRCYRAPLYENAEQILYAFYYRIYPDRVGKNIKDKDDWDLLRENGGPLSNEEFDNENSVYVPIPSVNIIHTKRQFFKLNNNL